MDYGLQGIVDADGLGAGTRAALDECVDVWRHNQPHNHKLERYYDGTVQVEGDLRVKSDRLKNDQACFWPAAAVDKLADRIHLDSMVLTDGGYQAENAGVLADVVRDSGIVNGYDMHLADKLLHGCMFATVTNAGDGQPRVRYHSANSAAAIPDPTGRTECGIVGAGFAITRMERTPWSGERAVPTQVAAFAPGRVATIDRVTPGRWTATDLVAPERDPMMFAFTHRPTGRQPFGKTRVSRFVRALSRDCSRVMFHMAVAGTFYSMPQMVMLGLTDEQYDAMVDQKTKLYLDSWILGTRDDDGNTPSVQRLAGASPEPFIAEIKALANMFSAATGIPAESLGATDLANPSSADAIEAAREDICLIANQDIRRDTEVLERVTRSALAVRLGTTTDGLPEDLASVTAHFRNPARTSTAEAADAALKVASVDDGFAGSDVFYEMFDFDPADIARVRSEKTKNVANAAMAAIFANGTGGE